MGIKMVLSGEGSDELFGGYLYFHKAPNEREFHEETVRKMEKLHLYDLLRANKALASWGVEGRVPFLDKEFIDIAMNLPPRVKMSVKLPDGTQRIRKMGGAQGVRGHAAQEIVWRQKGQFSDGVGYSWIDTLKEMTSKEISDKEFANAVHRFRSTRRPPKRNTTIVPSSPAISRRRARRGACRMKPPSPVPPPRRWNGTLRSRRWTNQADGRFSAYTTMRTSSNRGTRKRNDTAGLSYEGPAFLYGRKAVCSFPRRETMQLGNLVGKMLKDGGDSVVLKKVVANCQSRSSRIRSERKPRRSRLRRNRLIWPQAVRTKRR
jgi:hypothetical protein